MKQNLKKIIIIICLSVISFYSVSYIMTTQKKEGSIEKFLNDLSSCTEIALYAKDGKSNSSYRKIKSIFDKEKISEIIEIFRSSKDNQDSNDMLLYYRGHLIKFLNDNKVIAEYNEETIYNEYDYVKLNLSNDARHKIYSYYE